MVKLPWYVFWVAIIVCWPSMLLADGTVSATDPNGKLTLYKTPCSMGGWFEKWKSAHWMYKGKPYEACWAVQPTRQGGQMVIVIDSSGVVTPIDPRAFSEDQGV